MDANQTRFHLLLGEADWSRCTQLEAPPYRTQWDSTRYEVTLEEQLFRFLPSKFSPPLQIEQRRGAGQDRFGNWYWISDSEQEILVHSTGSDQTTHFWSPGDEVRSERRTAGDFQPAESHPPPSPVTLRGLAVTTDHYLIAGLVKPGGLLIFDLYSGGPPQQFFWPTTFAPFDLAARPGGGVWILDRENKRYWGLNRSFQILWLNKPPISSPPHQDLHHDFFAAEGSGQAAPKHIVNPPVSLDASVLLAASDPVAIESTPDGRVLILDSPPATISGVPRFSTVWLYQLATLLSSATTESLSIMLQLSNQDGFALVGHDFVFVAQYTDSKGNHLPDRIYITATNGDQTFAFNLVLDPHAGLRLLAQDVYLPMRLFNGKALVAVGADLYYGFRDTWVKLVAQKRHLYTAEAALMTEPFDGDEPDCLWHRLMLDGCLPPETAIEVWSRTANRQADLDSAPWLQEPPLCRRSNGSELPWLPQPARPNTGTWELLFQRAEGRFLQLQLRLKGNGRSTPRLRALRAYYPRFSYLKNYLPSLYREDRLSASFLDRFLANIEGTFTAIEDKIAAVQMLFDLQTAPADTLDWLAGWFGLVLDSSWDEARRRLLIRHAMDFFQWRGTIRGLVMGLRLAFEENPGPEMFTDAGAQSACARRFRVVEKFRTRRTPGLLLGAAAATNSSSSGFVSTQPGQRWTPAQGLGDLDRRYRAFLQTQDTSIHFTLARPDQTAAEQLWEAFAGQTLGFVPTVPPSDLANWQFFLSQRYGDITSLNVHHGANWAGFGAVTLPTTASVRPEVWNDWRIFVDKPGLGGGERLGWWQDFLARRYAAVSTLNAAYGTSWPEFALIPLLAELPANAAALSDWFQFEGIVLPFRAAAHRFSVLLPATTLEATDSQERLRTLQWASQIIELEKPAHTIFDVKFYWAFFRIGEARLGEDTQLGQGSRAPELLPPVIVDHAFLAEGYLAPAPPHDTRERRVLGRDSLGFGVVKQSDSGVHGGEIQGPRAVSYQFFTIDFPGATSTFLQSMNNIGQIVGCQRDANGVNHSLLTDTRSFTTFDPPGFTSASFPGTSCAIGINDSGEIVGNVKNNDNAGFQAYSKIDNNFSLYQHPNADPVQGTTFNGINNTGVRVGSFSDNTGTSHGLIQTGNTTTLLGDTVNLPANKGTFIFDINNLGQMVGGYFDPISDIQHGFFTDGKAFVTIDFPGSSTTWLNGINDLGQMAGAFFDDIAQDWHGFLTDGKTFTVLDYLDGPGQKRGTFLEEIDNSGRVVGYYGDDPLLHLNRAGIHGLLGVPVILHPTGPAGICSKMKN